VVVGLRAVGFFYFFLLLGMQRGGVGYCVGIWGVSFMIDFFLVDIGFLACILGGIFHVFFVSKV